MLPFIRCFIALARNQLRLCSSLEDRRLKTLRITFAAWRIGLGRILRARLLPAVGDEQEGARKSAAPAEAGPARTENSSERPSLRESRVGPGNAGVVSDRIEFPKVSYPKGFVERIIAVETGVAEMGGGGAADAAGSAGGEAEVVQVERRKMAHFEAKRGGGLVAGSGASAAPIAGHGVCAGGGSRADSITLGIAQYGAAKHGGVREESLNEPGSALGQGEGEWVLLARRNNGGAGSEDTGDEGSERHEDTQRLLPPSAFFVQTSSLSPRQREGNND